jgi:hypothetical protein
VNAAIDFILNILASGLTTVARAIHNVLTALWNMLVNLCHMAVQGEQLVYNKWLQLWDALRTYGGAAWTTLLWLKNTWVPQELSALRGAVVSYVNGLVNDARNLARSLYQTLAGWAQSAINTLNDWAHAAVNFLLGNLNQLIHDFNVIRDKVVALLTNPRILADWLVDALWHSFVQYAEGRSVAIGRWLLGKSVGAALAAAHLVEDVIVRIF